MKLLRYIAVVSVLVAVCLLPSFAMLRPQVGNINADAAIERVAIGQDGRLYAWDQHGSAVSGWPIDVSASQRHFAYGPRLIDLNIDQQMEVLVVSAANAGGDLQLHVFRGDASTDSSWHWDIPEASLREAPLLADVNHDSSLEIVTLNTAGDVRVYRRDFVLLESFSASVPEQSHLLVADLDNNGLRELYAGHGKTIYQWSMIGAVAPWVSLSGNASMVGRPVVADVNGDQYPDMVLATAQGEILAFDQFGKTALRIAAGDGVTFSGSVIVADVDLDQVDEYLVPSSDGRVLAFEPSGARVIDWGLSQRVLEAEWNVGTVADDRYTGIVSTKTGRDQRMVYRTKSRQYAQIVLGEQVQEWDEKAQFDFVEAIHITDLLTFPKPFTPNEDNVNDTTTLHYTLSDDAVVSIDLHDAHDRFVTKLRLPEPEKAGERSFVWNGRDTRGTATPNDDVTLDTGLYLLYVRAESDEGFVTLAKTSAIVNGVRAEIEAPLDADRSDANYPAVYGEVVLQGVAIDPNFGESQLDADFQSYKLYMRPGVWNPIESDVLAAGQQDSPWQPLRVPQRHQCPQNDYNEPRDLSYPGSNVSCRPVQHGVLGYFDASDSAVTPNGEYTVLLKVLDSNGNTEGKVSYDALVLQVANPVAGQPYDASNPFDPANPNNPKYSGPGIADVALSRNSLSIEQSDTTLQYRISGETSHVHVVIEPQGGGANAAIWSFSNVPAGQLQEVYWDGTDTLGRRVPGGTYQVRIVADAIDGTGNAEDASQSLIVAKGFAASDVLDFSENVDSGTTGFRVVPNEIDPLDIEANGVPQKAHLDFALTKPAKVSAQVLEPLPDGSFKLHKTLFTDRVAMHEQLGDYWDGTGENGLILPVGKDYVIRLTAESIDVGNAATLVQDAVVTLSSAALNANIPASISKLKGYAGQEVQATDPLQAIQGSSDLVWSASATGRVDMPFSYTISASGEEKYGEPQVSYETTEDLYVCTTAGVVLGLINNEDFKPCVNECEEQLPDTNDDVTQASLSIPEGSSLVSIDVIANGFGMYATQANAPFIDAPFSLGAGESKSWSVNGGVDAGLSNVSVSAKAVLEEDQWDGNPNLQSCVDTEVVCGQQEAIQVGSCGGTLNGTAVCSHKTLYKCGSIVLSALVGGGEGQRSWGGGEAHISSGSGSLSSINGNPHANLAQYSGAVGSGLADTKEAWVTGYQFTATNVVNGVSTTLSSSGDEVTFPGLGVWLSGGQLSAKIVHDGALLSTYNTTVHDPYFGDASNKMAGKLALDQQQDSFSHVFDPTYFYYDGYAKQFPNLQPGASLYSFSDRVHLEQWQVDVRYPNISKQHPNGENVLNTGSGALKVFALDEVKVHSTGSQGVTNNNVDDYFRLRLLPDAAPKRFVEIYGSASANYELYYYDANAAEPQWHRISERTSNPVTNGLLAHWDVTRLNGERYTVVLRSQNGGSVNVDTFYVGIGEEVSVAGLDEGEFLRVSTPYRRASLLFGANSIAEDTLITITPVDSSEAEFALPSNIAPIGPIFDIKPDDADVNFAHHVQLEMLFTPDELEEAFGVADASELTIYNLAADNMLEGLVTVATFDDGNDADPSNDVWRFTANMEHFSQYVLAKPQAAHIALLYPPSGQVLNGNLPIVARAEKTPRPKDDKLANQELAPLVRMTAKYYPIDDPGAAVIVRENTNPTPTPNVSMIQHFWDTGELSGEYIVLIEAETAAGEVVRYERKVLFDNSPLQSQLLINGVPVESESEVRIASGAVVEIVARHEELGEWQAEPAGIVFAWDDDNFQIYEQAFTLDKVPGTYELRYISVDGLGNQEPEQHVTLVVSESQASADSAVQISLAIEGPVVAGVDKSWVNAQSLVRLSADDPLADIMYRAHDGSYQLYGQDIALYDVGDGLFEIDYFHIDRFGLRGAVQTKKLAIDNVPPVSQVRAVGLHRVTQAGWYVDANAVLHVDAVDQGAIPVGVDSTMYRWGEGEWLDASTGIAVAEGGTLAVRSCDLLGNCENPQLIEVTIDDQAPVTTLVHVPTVLSPNGDGRHDSFVATVFVQDNLYEEFTLNGSLTDSAGEVVQLFEYDLAVGQNEIVWDGLVDGVLLPDGSYGVHLQVVDGAGNAAEAYQGALIYDVTPPSIAVLNGVVRAFSPNTDNYQDVLQVQYDVTDAQFTQDIVTTLQLYAAQEHVLHETTLVVSDTSVPQSISWNGTNAMDNGVFDGDYTFALIAEDPAGNRSSPQIDTASDAGVILVDRKAPYTELLVDGAHHWVDETLWLGATAVLRIDATDDDPSAGVESVQYRIGGQPWKVYAGPMTTPQFTHEEQIQYFAQDLVGNSESVHKAALQVDTTAPESSLSIGVPKDLVGDRLYVAPETELQIEAGDGVGVGVRDLRFTVSGAPDVSRYTQPIKFAGLPDGAYTLQYWAEDYVENEEGVHSRDLWLDGTAPQSHVEFVGAHYHWSEEKTVLVRPDTTLRIHTVAERDDVAAVYVRLDEGDWRALDTLQLPEPGRYFVEFYAEDRLGNAEVVQQQWIEVDDAAPQVLATPQVPSAASGWHILPRSTIALSADSVGAPLDYIEYRIDDAGYRRYDAAFTLENHALGQHTIYYRAVDVLGNVSVEESLDVELQHIEVERAVDTKPRILAFMLQTHDLRAHDPRPNQRLLELAAEQLGAIVTIVSGDHNDPGTLSRFVREMRSDMYDTYVLATDALVVDFFESARIDAFLRELRARVAKGDGLVLMTNQAQIDSALWYSLLSPFTSDTADYDAAFGSLAGQSAVLAQRYHRGAIANVGADLGRLAEEGTALYDELRDGFAALLRTIGGSDAMSNAHEVQDVTLTLRNNSDQSVQVELEDLVPDALRIDNSVHYAGMWQREMTLAAGEERTEYYLYRNGALPTQEGVVTNVLALWDHGLEQEDTFAADYAVPYAAVGLLQTLLHPDALLHAMPAATAKLQQVQRRMTVGAGQGLAVQENIALIVDAIEILESSHIDGRSEVIVLLGELVELLGASDTARSIEPGVATATSVSESEEELHGDTVSFIGHGSGGCALVPQGGE